MTRLEDFLNEFTEELGIELKNEDGLRNGFLNQLYVSYHKDDDIEYFSVHDKGLSMNNEAEILIVKYPDKSDFSLRVGIPSLQIQPYMNRLDDNKPLFNLFADQFRKRDEEDDGDENSVLNEYTHVTDLAQVKTLIHKLFFINMAYEEIAQEFEDSLMQHHNSGWEIIETWCDFYDHMPDKQGRKHFSDYVEQRLKTEKNSNIVFFLQEAKKHYDNARR